MELGHLLLTQQNRGSRVHGLPELVPGRPELPSTSVLDRNPKLFGTWARLIKVAPSTQNLTAAQPQREPSECNRKTRAQKRGNTKRNPKQATKPRIEMAKGHQNQKAMNKGGPSCIQCFSAFGSGCEHDSLRQIECTWKSLVTMAGECEHAHTSCTP